MFTCGRLKIVAVFLLITAGTTAAGCKSKPSAAAQRPMPEVAVVVVNTEAMLRTTELPGRTSPYLVAEVRPQVSGIIDARLFEEGQDVTEGQVLYQIDAARYQAAYDQAKAALAVAEAELPALKARAERYSRVLGKGAVSEQDYDEAIAALKQGEATIDLRAAELQSARIDLSYTKITAPISGRISRSDVTVGSLVTTNQSVALATIRQFDPVYVDVMQSSAELLRLKREWESGGLSADENDLRKVRLILEDETPYAIEGELQFRDIAVDTTTGSYSLRVVFPNPDHLLLPGMFVRAIVQDGVIPNAILVPQKGISRNTKGQAVALLVGEGDVVQQVVVNVDSAVGNRWLVTEGLSAGDRLIVEGVQAVRPGATVRVVPFDAQGQTSDAQTTSSQPASDSQ